MLNEYLPALKQCFDGTDPYAAHRKAAPLLVEMAKDKNVLHTLVRHALDDATFLQKVRHHPTIAFPIEQNSDFTMVANCFFPLPDRASNISHQSIHHHGNLLLTTVGAFGEGYESLVFKKNFQIDKGTGETSMQIDRLYRNELHHVEFIEAYTPHVVFFPRQLSITIAMWSANKKTTADRLRRFAALQYFKKPIITLIKATGASKLVELNVVEDFDFYPKGKKIYALKERVFGYTEGTNANFIQNVFFILQEIGFEDRHFLRQLKERCIHQHAEVVRWIDALTNGDRIPDLFERNHLGIEKVNLKKEDILGVFN